MASLFFLIPRRLFAFFFVALVCLQSASAVPIAAPKDVWIGVVRVVAIGDLHGDYQKFLAALNLAHLIDAKGDWIGGRAHLVQTGDILDRGPDADKIIDHLMRLEQQANRAGGHVHALIGNHEAINIAGDRHRKAGPPHHSSHRDAFSSQSKYGRWILGHNAIVKIDGTLFVHGGISPKYAGSDLHSLNQAIRQELSGKKDYQTGIAADREGPLWYRGLAESPMESSLAQLLDEQKARRIVIGHTVQARGITLLFDGRLALIDVGMSSKMNDAPPACLEIRPGPGGVDKVTILSRHP